MKDGRQMRFSKVGARAVVTLRARAVAAVYKAARENLEEQLAENQGNKQALVPDAQQIEENVNNYWNEVDPHTLRDNAHWLDKNVSKQISGWVQDRARKFAEGMKQQAEWVSFPELTAIRPLQSLLPPGFSEMTAARPAKTMVDRDSVLQAAAGTQPIERGRDSGSRAAGSTVDEGLENWWRRQAAFWYSAKKTLAEQGDDVLGKKHISDSIAEQIVSNAIGHYRANDVKDDPEDLTWIQENADEETFNWVMEVTAQFAHAMDGLRPVAERLDLDAIARLNETAEQFANDPEAAISRAKEAEAWISSAASAAAPATAERMEPASPAPVTESLEQQAEFERAYQEFCFATVERLKNLQLGNINYFTPRDIDEIEKEAADKLRRGERRDPSLVSDVGWIFNTAGMDTCEFVHAKGAEFAAVQAGVTDLEKVYARYGHPTLPEPPAAAPATAERMESAPRASVTESTSLAAPAGLAEDLKWWGLYRLYSAIAMAQFRDQSYLVEADFDAIGEKARDDWSRGVRVGSNDESFKVFRRSDTEYGRAVRDYVGRKAGEFAAAVTGKAAPASCFSNAKLPESPAVVPTPAERMESAPPAPVTELSAKLTGFWPAAREFCFAAAERLNNRLLDDINYFTPNDIDEIEKEAAHKLRSGECTDSHLAPGLGWINEVAIPGTLNYLIVKSTEFAAAQIRRAVPEEFYARYGHPALPAPPSKAPAPTDGDEDASVLTARDEAERESDLGPFAAARSTDAAGQAHSPMRETPEPAELRAKNCFWDCVFNRVTNQKRKFRSNIDQEISDIAGTAQREFSLGGGDGDFPDAKKAQIKARIGSEKFAQLEETAEDFAECCAADAMAATASRDMSAE